MKRAYYRNVRHVNARPNEWVQVHRASPPASSGDDWGEVALQVGLWVGGVLLGLWLLSLVLPYLMLGLGAWAAFRILASD